jgi:hypothetical protein
LRSLIACWSRKENLVMANNLSNAAEDLMLNWINGVGTPTRPTTPLKVRLYTTLPNQETGAGGTEVTGGSYASTNVTFTTASGGAAENTADVTFPTASASWGTVVGIAVWDSAGTPVMLWSGTLTSSKTVDNGDTFKIPAGSLDVTLD